MKERRVGVAQRSRRLTKLVGADVPRLREKVPEPKDVEPWHKDVTGVESGPVQIVESLDHSGPRNPAKQDADGGPTKTTANTEALDAAFSIRK